MLMSVIIEDSLGLLAPDDQKLHSSGSLDVLLYADDTLLLGSDGMSLQRLLNTIAEVGARYGMELHWSKFQLLPVSGDYKLSTPRGDAIEPKDMMTYLGASIYADGG